MRTVCHIFVENSNYAILIIVVVVVVVVAAAAAGVIVVVVSCGCCSELLEISHIRTIYHIFVAILIVFMLNTFVCDIVEQGR